MNLIEINNTLLRTIAAIILFLAGIIVANILSKLTKKLLKELEVNKILKTKLNIKLPIENIISGTLKYLIYFITIILALNQLGITTKILYVIFIGIMVVIITTILLSIKDFVPNIISGFIIHKKNKINVGDKIKVKNLEGKVIEINLLETKIENKDKEVIHIPNSLITKEGIIKKK